MTSILKKEGVQIMGEHRMPNPPFPGGHNTAFTPAQERADHVIQVTQDAQREALLQAGIEDDAITQLEADDRFDEQVYTVGELLDLVEMLVEDVGCAESLLGAEVPMTKGLRGAVKAFRGRQLAELRRLKAGRVVV